MLTALHLISGKTDRQLVIKEEISGLSVRCSFFWGVVGGSVGARA